MARRSASLLIALATATAASLVVPAATRQSRAPVTAGPHAAIVPATGASPDEPLLARRQRRPAPRIAWRRSTALGSPSGGALRDGVRLPAAGEHFFTWDPVRKRAPNRPWRRHGTDRLLRVLLRVAERFAAAHPRAPRLAIGDLSRPRGGDFGRRFGPVGHVSHQNGLDADVYLPRRDGRERAPRTAREVDRMLAQTLVDSFVRAGAELVLVGPRSGLDGPPAVVQPWPAHEDHLHVRIAPPRR